MNLRVRYSRFWPSFNADENFFSRLLKQSGYDLELVQRAQERVDLEIMSVFPTRRELGIKKLRHALGGAGDIRESALRNTSDVLAVRESARTVWFTGENVRVPDNPSLSASLSFDQDNYGGLNTYFPLWQLHLDWFGEPEFNYRVGLSVQRQTLLEPRSLKDTSTKKFACAFIGNSHPIRTRALEALSKMGESDAYGKAAGNPVLYKRDVSERYRFMLCFENDLYPGYVTEKLLDAYLSGCVPLYWGDLGNDTLINRDSFINLKDFSSIDEFAEHVKALSPSSYREMYEQPFLTQNFEIDSVRQALMP